MSFLASLFCKKRKSPQPSHSSSPLKETPNTKNPTLPNNNGKRISQPSQPEQGESNDRLKESTQTQLISDSEEEVAHSETKQLQKSENQSGGISATTASSKKKEQDIQTKEEKHKKTTDKVENFMQGEGLQATVKKTQNNEDTQKKKNNEKRTEQQNNKEDNHVEARDVQEIDEDELSYQGSSSASDSLADFDEISQVETEYVSIEDNRHLENSERAPNAKEGQNMKRTKEEALEELKKFPLDKLIMTKEKDFDSRRKLTKKYLVLCEEAGEDAISYYYNEMYKPGKQVRAEEKKENSTKGDLEKADNGEEAALKELKKFPLNELKMTKDQLFDKRYKQTKTYLDLCEKAKKDPDQYYKENMN